ncbi:heavy metal translocating P-type ATPase [Halodesulfovibrio marinisediminis]|uniref:P-type Zn(2+) transporter n=1 Tax=Halodesulfovibrio marinisediminis DSM 17456 TaxID=1121457 RepID=A0A1N6J3H3_9BACT|nr:heavy metal translocating P-type ATPase [Halodesulfovibrio marinisediminis]SIO38840.1 Cd2+/Zn2+-exporting ATPase [Halodesulfovibrio marinisediminis DSM 17456]
MAPTTHRHSTFEEAAHCETCSTRARQERNSLFFNTDAIMLYTAAVLFLLELFLEDFFHRHNLHFWEFIFVLAAYVLAGGTVLTNAAKTVLRGDFFDENVLMVIATAGALAIHAYAEAIGIMIFFKVGELMQALAVARSRRSIKSLLASKPETARVQTATGIVERIPEDVTVGEKVTVRPGEKVPLDGVILEGSSQVNSAAITGESVPISAHKGDSVMAGQICINGAITLRVTRLFKESSIAKVMDLVEHATERKAKTEKFITTFARYYTPYVVLIACAVAFIPSLIMGGDLTKWVYRALVLLVISCPCALVISIPLGYFGGIGRASSSGILIKGSNFIDALAGVTSVAFDKTGTLTHGIFVVKNIQPAKGFSKDQLMEYAAAAEFNSTHPIALSILEYFKANDGALNENKLEKAKAISGQGTNVTYQGHNILAGNASLLAQQQISFPQSQQEGTIVYVAVDRSFAGTITIGDALRDDAAEAIQKLKEQGIESIMLTGDNEKAARTIAESLKLDKYHAGLLPEEKVAFLEKLQMLQNNDGHMAFVGDGINDAPVIARADVGIAMGGLGSDAAIESADVVLMTDSPSKVPQAISIARQTRIIVWQNILFAFAVKGIFITLGIFGIATMWEAVFADVGTSLLALANSTRIFTFKR